MQYEQQNQEHLHEYEMVAWILTNVSYFCNILTVSCCDKLYLYRWQQSSRAQSIESRKNPIRTYWRKKEEKKDETLGEESVEWWEEENVGYNEDSDAEPEFYWNEDLKNGTDDGRSNEK